METEPPVDYQEYKAELLIAIQETREELDRLWEEYNRLIKQEYNK